MLNCFKLFLREYGYHLNKSLMIALTDFSVFCTTIVCESVVAVGVSGICWCFCQLIVAGQTICLLESIWGSFDKLEQL